MIHSTPNYIIIITAKIKKDRWVIVPIPLYATNTIIIKLST